jgi:Sulfotransferase family
MTGIFIVGAPRSGTTLLQSLISSHSEFFSPPETSFFLNMLPLLGVRHANPDYPISKDGINLIKQDFERMTGLALAIDGTIFPGMSVKGVFEELIAGFNKENKPRWVEKTTNHARCMLTIRRFYPEAKFIHLIRDPVDSIASMASIKPISIADFRITYVSSYYGFARLWKKNVLSALRYPDQENVLHIFYEDLVLKPRATLERVCTFLRVPFEESLMETFHQSARSLFSGESCPWQQDNLVPGFHTDAVHKWRRSLPPYKVWLIQKYTQDLARYLGYYERVGVRSRLMIPLYVFIDQIMLVVSVTRLEMLVRKLVVGIFK